MNADCFMNDPLTEFEWSSLYDKYDEACKRFDCSSLHLSRFGPNRPVTDRLLYYRLIECYSLPSRSTDPDPAGTFEALLYWKYYSQGTASYNISKLGKSNTDQRRSVEGRLKGLLTQLPRSIDKDVHAVEELVRSLTDYDLPCMGSCAIPTRTTLLHFLFPSVVPIFDKQVLKAVGVAEHNANRSYTKLRQYLPHAWQLDARYSSASGISHKEQSLRRIDMALWVNRGSK